MNDARALLDRHGLLLLQDAALPSLATLVAGEPVRGSWWGHPASKQIFAIATELAHDVVTAKLVGGKVTFVHARLMPELVAIGSERARWQMHELSPAAAKLLRRVDAEQKVRVSGRDAKELELRLLVASGQVHTETGDHALELSTWQPLERTPTAAEARATLEATLAALPCTGKRGKLPWQ